MLNLNQLHNAFTLFLSLLVEAIPFLLLGVLLSSFLLLVVDERNLIAKFPRNPVLGALVGSCVGFLFPVCECGNVPVARRLLLKGVSPAVSISFLLAAPTINPVVIWSTWVAFGDRPQIVILRVVFSLIIATVVGIIFSVQKNAQGLMQPALAKRLKFAFQPNSLQPDLLNQEEVPFLLQSGTFLLNNTGKTQPMDQSLISSSFNNNPSGNFLLSRKWQLFLDNVNQELQELGGMLIIGSAIAASIQVFVPRDIVFSLGQDNITSILAMMLLAAIVSICSTVDSFFALSFAGTFTSSSLLAFLVFGPTIDIKAIGLMLSIFKPKIIIYLFAIVAQLTFLMTFIHSYLY
ncbi:MAG: permease [Xenococcus sp. MO_188.B8]|nr:permease [Xenococcus sp. MO_188.B8]